MKKAMKIYFGVDACSAVLSLLVFMSTVFLLLSHLYIGVGAFGIFVECIFCFMGWNLVRAVYVEGRNEIKRRK